MKTFPPLLDVLFPIAFERVSTRFQVEVESIGFEADLLEDLPAESSGARATLQLLVAEGDVEEALKGLEGLLELRRGQDRTTFWWLFFNCFSWFFMVFHGF